MSIWQGALGPTWRGDAGRFHSERGGRARDCDALMRAVVEVATAAIGVQVGNNVWCGAYIVHRDRDHRSRETEG